MVSKHKEFFYKILEHGLTYFGNLHYSSHPFFIYYRKDRPGVCYTDAYEELKKIIKPGDILLQHKNNQMLNWFVPGRFTHSGIYVGDFDGQKGRVVHSSSPKVQVTDLIYFLKCNELVVLRPNISDEEKDIAVNNAIDSIGNPYDYTFIFNEKKKRKRLSCSGLLYTSFLHVHKKLNWKIKIHKPWFFRKIFIPDDMLPKNGSNVNIILSKRYK